MRWGRGRPTGDSEAGSDWGALLPLTALKSEGRGRHTTAGQAAQSPGLRWRGGGSPPSRTGGLPGNAPLPQGHGGDLGGCALCSADASAPLPPPPDLWCTAQGQRQACCAFPDAHRRALNLGPSEDQASLCEQMSRLQAHWSWPCLTHGTDLINIWLMNAHMLLLKHRLHGPKLPCGRDSRTQSQCGERSPHVHRAGCFYDTTRLAPCTWR